MVSDSTHVCDGHLILSESDKDELFNEFLVRYSELDKEDKRTAAAQNTSAMSELTKYWNEQTRRASYASDISEGMDWLYREYDGRLYFAADGLYNAYLAIRKVVPYAVGAKRSLEGKKIAGSHPGYKRTYVLNPETDKEEAYDIGKRLIDVMLEYLKEATLKDGYDRKDKMPDKN